MSRGRGGTGLVVAVYSACYMLAAMPLGAIVDRMLRAPQHVAARRIKGLVLAGWLGLAASFAMLGPLSPLAPLAMLSGSMAVGGLASAAVVVPSLPELQLGLAVGDEKSRAVLCSIWNGLYSGGAAAGPFLTALVYAARGFMDTTLALLGFSLACATLLALMLAARVAAARRGPALAHEPLVGDPNAGVN
mmetsp:Transcript_26006/g.87785  ORF Transcript_26006/g.87785 Transcript_26006/m.87785 type:complete len:190 (+) Transcript_26006:1009-1578(+)